MARVRDIIRRMLTSLFTVVWLPVMRLIWEEHGAASQVRLPNRVFVTTLRIIKAISYYIWSSGYCLGNNLFERISPRHIGRLSKDEQEAFERKKACYRHASLDRSSQEIRLIKLSRLFSSSKLSSELLIVPLDHAPEYEAISYTWAGQPLDHFIEFGHNNWIRVTENVFKIIHDMAPSGKPRYLWIDAVCINQKDLVEKRSQIEMMEGIYGKAMRVIAWLGSPESSIFDVPTANVSRMLNLLGRVQYCIANYEKLRPGLEQGKLLVGSREDWKAFHHFIDHPYWTRLWIIQEIVLAREVLLFYEGHYVRWEQIEEMLPLQQERFREINIRESSGFGLSSLGSELNFNLIRILRTQTQNKLNWVPLAAAIRATHTFQCNDPRDKVYGLLALIHPDERIPADYTISPEDVFTRVASEILRQGAVVLDQAGIGHPRQLNSLPTWVPDWTLYSSKVKENLDLYATNSKRYNAGGLGLMVVAKFTPQTIKVEAIPVSKLRYLGPSFPKVVELAPELLDNFDIASSTFLIEAAAFFEQTPDVYARTGQSRTEAIWRTILGDRVRTAADRSKVTCPAPPEFGQCFEIYLSACLLAPTRNGVEVPYGVDPRILQQNIDLYKRGTFANCNSRRAAITEDMTMLIAPEFADEGDLVCVLPGMHSPLVIRPKKHSTCKNDAVKVWELVGDCFAHGLMFGEALTTGRKQTFIIE